LSQAKDEQNSLKEELKQILDTLTYDAMVENDAKMAEDANRIQVNVPMSIYVG
jgi:hypothetical protein